MNFSSIFGNNIKIIVFCLEHNLVVTFRYVYYNFLRKYIIKYVRYLCH